MKTASASDIAVIHQWLDDLENAVITAEALMRTRDWDNLTDTIAEQRRTTHGLANAIEAAGPIATIERVRMDLRMRAIIARRATQIDRLAEFHAAVGVRLRELTKFKFAMREMGSEPPTLALDVER